MAGNEVLSEGELDALMSSADTSPADGASDGQYRSFDFTSREQSLLAQFVSLKPVIERHAELLCAALDSVFARSFTLEHGAARLVTFGDLAMSLDETVGIGTLNLAPLAGNSHIISNPDLLSYLVNQYYGGGRTASPATRSRAALSGSELRMAERLAELVLETMTPAWADKLVLAPGELSVDMYPDALAAEPPGDLALCIPFSVGLEDGTSQIQVVIPFAALEPHKARFAPPRRREREQEAPSWEPYFRRELLDVQVELAAILSSRDISLAELLELRVGDVISLPMSGSAALNVEGEPFGSGEYGAHKGHKAIKIRAFKTRRPSQGRGE